MVTLSRSCAHFHYRQVSLGNRDDKLAVVLVHMSVVMQNYWTSHECCNLCTANSARVNTWSWHWSQSINWDEGRLIKNHLNATNRGVVINFVCWCSSVQREAFGDLQRHWSYCMSLVTFSKRACFLMQAKCLWPPQPMAKQTKWVTMCSGLVSNGETGSSLISWQCSLAFGLQMASLHPGMWRRKNNRACIWKPAKCDPSFITHYHL